MRQGAAVRRSVSFYYVGNIVFDMFFIFANGRKANFVIFKLV